MKQKLGLREASLGGAFYDFFLGFSAGFGSFDVFTVQFNFSFSLGWS